MNRINQGILFTLLFGVMQVPVYGQLDLGIITGLQNSSFSGIPPKNTSYNSQMNFSIGGIAEYCIAEDVYLSFRPMYQPKGTTISFDVPGQREQVDSLGIFLKYLSLPVLVKVYADNKKFYIVGGLNFGILLDAEIEQLLEDQSPINIKDGIRPYDLTVQFGIGYQFSLGRPKLNLEAHYVQGLLNISESFKGENGLQLPDEFKTRGLQFWLGLLFPLGNEGK